MVRNSEELRLGVNAPCAQEGGSDEPEDVQEDDPEHNARVQ